MEKVTFTSAEFGDTLIEGLSVDFKITYHKEKEGLRKDIDRNCWYKITLTTVVLHQWGLMKDINKEKLIKIAFPFAVELITERVKNNQLEDFEEKIISAEDEIDTYPFDLQKIGEIEGYEIQF